MELAYISDNRIYTYRNDRTEELPCGRLDKYKEALADIRRRTEWKTTGSGAKFMGMDRPSDDDENIRADITGIASYEGRLVYGIRLDESGSIYIRSLDRTDNDESLVISGKEIFPGRMCCRGNKLVVSCGENYMEKHISLYELPSSVCREFTDGDSIEECPSFDGDDRLYFSTAGYARNESGHVTAVQHKSIAVLDTVRCSMEEVLSDEKYDYLRPVPDGKGGIYCIRQTAGGVKNEDNGILKDIIMFPFRMIKALGGMLNLFSMAFGGEALKSGGNARAKEKDQRQIVIDGNIINAERNLKDAESRGEKYPGIMPRDRVLLHVSAEGEEKVISCGVLDYLPLSDGGIAVSNGRHIIIRNSSGEQTAAFKADRAVSLIEI